MEKGIKSMPWEFVLGRDEKETGGCLSNVIGHESQKEEIILILNWFKNLQYWKSKNVSLPKGVLLYGKPGNGKSLLIREAIKESGLPAYIFKGSSDNICEDLDLLFERAKNLKGTILVIDELDLLIDKDSKVTRTLQENLDGVQSNDDILVFAATNDLWDIPDPLLRNGRFEKIIQIPNPTNNEALELLKSHFLKFGIELPTDISEDELKTTLAGISCAGIKTIASDVVLRNGFENISGENILESIYRITNKVQNKEKKNYFNVAIHEAGHAVMAAHFPNYFEITRLDINQDGGKLCVREIDEDFWTYEKIIADIEIYYAGIIAEKIICNSGSAGCEHDMQNATRLAWKIINECAYKSCSDTLPEVKPFTYIRLESECKKHNNIKRADKILKKCEKFTIKFLKRNKSRIINLANKLFEKKFLRSSEVLSVI